MSSRASAPVALAVLSAGAGAVHFAVLADHFAMSVAHGAFFAAVGWAQLMWALAVLLRPGRALFLAGLAGNAAVAVVWALSRTIGLPPGRSEPLGVPDVLATLLELAVVSGCAYLADRAPAAVPAAAPATPQPATPQPATPQPATPQPATPQPATPQPATPQPSAADGSLRLTGAGLLSGVVALAVGAAFLPAFAGHSHAGHAAPVAAGAGDAQAQAAPAHQHEQAAPAGQAADGQTGGEHHHDTPTGPPPTEAERAAADDLVARTAREVPARWPTLAAARKAGFQLSIDTSGVLHMTKPAWIIDDRELDPTRPESLVFYRKPGGGDILLGAMFIMPPGKPGPQVGGSLTRWHAHDNLCSKPAGGVAVVDASGGCPAGTTKMPSTPEMLHVWVVDYPSGPFGDATAPSLRTAIGALLAKGN
ncbi:hypothetical protein [Nonomuraea soli]|uniref:Uncharacterized protein n=1 Tax=Nonomuraea soli TaxID=1032476 RepID=A0A7W0CPV4_9ACTN|nr:hypothetical protein [Nonomuraea soli]MBA2894890.1 hypothetical protein [Nonomuraea soli]